MKLLNKIISAIIARVDHLKKAITPRAAEERNIHLDHAEVHRRLKKKQIATK